MFAWLWFSGRQTGKLNLSPGACSRDKLNLRAFHDFLWKNGNVPIALQRWEYLGADEGVPK
jgi:hypothetical protein